jgi:hypothetical protein
MLTLWPPCFDISYNNTLWKEYFLSSVQIIYDNNDDMTNEKIRSETFYFKDFCSLEQKTIFSKIKTEKI